MSARFAGLVAAAVVAVASHAPAQSRTVYDTIRSPSLAGNLIGDSPVRQVLVYLPPSYRSHPERRYPVLYLIHGFTSAAVEWVDGTYQGLDVRMAMDSLLGASRNSMPEFIVVMPDADSKYGGAFYTDSPVSGGWESYIVRDVVRHVDSSYRTIADRLHRALAGLSMGGFGAITLGARHPDLFGMVYAMSPCCASFVGEFAPTSPAWAVLDTARTTTLGEAAGGAWLVRAAALALSPAPTAPQLYGALPMRRGSGGMLESDPSVMQRWRAHMPIGLVHRWATPGTPRPELHLEYGLHDEIPSVTPGVIELSHALDSLGIRYTVETFDGGHVSRFRQRISEHTLPAVGRWFARQ